MTSRILLAALVLLLTGCDDGKRSLDPAREPSRSTCDLCPPLSRPTDAILTLHVAPDGDDCNDGTSEAEPVAHLWRVQELLKCQKPDSEVHVLFEGGTYYDQMVKDDLFVVWNYFNGHRILFKPREEGLVPVFDGQSGEPDQNVYEADGPTPAGASEPAWLAGDPNWKESQYFFAANTTLVGDGYGWNADPNDWEAGDPSAWMEGPGSLDWYDPASGWWDARLYPSSSGSMATRLEFYGLTVRNFWDIHIFLGQKSSKPITHNRVSDCIFEKLGASHVAQEECAAWKYPDGSAEGVRQPSADLCFAHAAIDVSGGDHNLFQNNDFRFLENVVNGADLSPPQLGDGGVDIGACCDSAGDNQCHRTKVHGLYFAKESHHNVARDNRFHRISGVPVKLRDLSSFNVIVANEFYNYVGSKAHISDKFSPGECPSWQTLLLDNEHPARGQLNRCYYGCDQGDDWDDWDDWDDFCGAPPDEFLIDDEVVPADCSDYESEGWGWQRFGLQSPPLVADYDDDGRDAIAILWEKDSQTHVAVHDWDFGKQSLGYPFGWHEDGDHDIVDRPEWFANYVAHGMGIVVPGDFNGPVTDDPNGTERNELAVLWEKDGSPRLSTLATEDWLDWGEASLSGRLGPSTIEVSENWLANHVRNGQGFVRVGDYFGDDDDDEIAVVWSKSDTLFVTSFDADDDFSWTTQSNGVGWYEAWGFRGAVKLVLSGDYDYDEATGNHDDEIVILAENPEGQLYVVGIRYSEAEAGWVRYEQKIRHQSTSEHWLLDVVDGGQGVVRTGDFNGDGRDELGVLWQDAEGVKITTFSANPDHTWNDGLTQVVKEGSWLEEEVLDGQGYVLVGDHDGDGEDGFIVLWSDGTARVEDTTRLTVFDQDIPELPDLTVSPWVETERESVPYPDNHEEAAFPPYSGDSIWQVLAECEEGAWLDCKVIGSGDEPAGFVGIMDIDGDRRDEVVVMWELVDSERDYVLPRAHLTPYKYKTMTTSFDWDRQDDSLLADADDGQWKETTDATREGEGSWLDTHVRNGSGVVVMQPAVGP